MKQHRKSKNKNDQAKIRMMNVVADRTPMPRPTQFRDKSKYNRNTSKQSTRQMLAAY